MGQQAGEGGELLVVSSSGGVLADVAALAAHYPGHRRWVVTEAPDTHELLADVAVQFRDEQSPRRPMALVRELRAALAELRDRRPALVLSAGTGLAVPWFAAARWLGIPTVWVETFNIVGSDGVAARCCARIATLVVVQRPERLGLHPRSVHVGELV